MLKTLKNKCLNKVLTDGNGEEEKVLCHLLRRVACHTTTALSLTFPTFPHRFSADNEIVASREKGNFWLCSVFIRRRQANILNTKGYAWARTRSPFTVTLMKRLKFTALATSSHTPPRLLFKIK